MTHVCTSCSLLPISAMCSCANQKCHDLQTSNRPLVSKTCLSQTNARLAVALGHSMRQSALRKGDPFKCVRRKMSQRWTARFVTRFCMGAGRKRRMAMCASRSLRDVPTFVHKSEAPLSRSHQIQMSERSSIDLGGMSPYHCPSLLDMTY